MMASIEQIRDMLPGVHDTVWLNTGTCGPLCRPAYGAMAKELSRDLTRARIDADHFPSLRESRGVGSADEMHRMPG